MADQGSSTDSSTGIGFDPQKYLALQSEHIQARRDQFDGKLYLEFGGKLFDDMHASRVLPGFLPDTKITMLEQLKDQVEVVIAVAAPDIAAAKVRADLGIPYEDDVLRLIDEFRAYGLYVGSVVLTRFTPENHQATAFKQWLEKLGLTVYTHYPIDGYPHNVAKMVSDQGFGRNDYIETSRDLVIVTAPGPGSGKMATCLSQLYHDHQRGISSGYAKFETFPIWNLPLDHPVNVAYEAATADLGDVNLIDPFHLSAYGERTVNYNRDVEIFPVLNLLIERINGASPYKSPTDMGVNMAGLSISDDEACRQAAEQEVIRRYCKALVVEKRDGTDSTLSDRIALLMGQLGISVSDRPAVEPCLAVAAATGAPGAAIELADGEVVQGKTSPLLGCCSAMLLNAMKHLAGIAPEVDLLSPDTIRPIQSLKTQDLGSRNPRLHMDEVLIALAVGANENEDARAALAQLTQMRGLNVHTSTILGPVDEGIFRSLGIQVTSEPVFQGSRLYHRR